MRMAREYKAYLLIAGLALLSWWLAQSQLERQQWVTVAENSPDLMSIGYYKLSMNAEGLPKSELTAAEMAHYPHDGSNHFVQPVMSLFKANQAPWLIRSETAIMAGDGDNLQLNGKAVVSRDATASSRALTVISADLRVKLSTHYAETQAYTELLSPPNKTTGKGMEVIFTSPINLKLLSTVKGYYELNNN